MRTRFAPAPTGYLHLGHVLNADCVWTWAREHDGQVLLRIEDHDAERSRSEFERTIREDLAWLGFVPDDEAPRQSTRGSIYRDALQPLIDRGLVFGCTCTRQEISAHAALAMGEAVGPTNSDAAELRYPGTCRHRGIALSDGVGWRVRMDAGTESFVDGRLGPQTHDPSAQCGDVLVRDRRGNWTYQWVVVVDDHLLDITHVIRGEDLLASTGRQIRLARLIGRTTPPQFVHHPLIMKSAAQKLSKSDGDTGVRDLRAAGWTPARVIAAARRLSAGC